MPPVITTQKKKFAGGKVIALGLFLLVGGLGAGIMLVGQNQNIQEQAGCYSICMNEIGDSDECAAICDWQGGGTGDTPAGGGGDDVPPECQSSGECGAGERCNSSGHCVADTTSGGGGSIPPPGDGGTGCSTDPNATNYCGTGIFFCTPQQYAANGGTCDSGDVANGTQHFSILCLVVL
jgi:hypothetical protein